METKKARNYSRYTKEAVILLGKQVQLGRKERGLTEKDLAERAGISRTTLQKIEKGDLKCELGLALEVAVLVGVKLFEAENLASFSAGIDRVSDKIALFPKSIRKKQKGVDDAF